MADFYRPEYGLDEAEEEADAYDHDDDGEQMPGCARKCDVTEACGCERGDGEIKRVYVILDLRIGAHLKHIDDGGDDEDKDRQVEDRMDDLFILLEKGKDVAQVAQDAIRAHKADGAHDPQENEVFDENGCDQGQEDDDIHPGCKLGHVAQSIGRDPVARGDVGQDDKCDTILNCPDPGSMFYQ